MPYEPFQSNEKQDYILGILGFCFLVLLPLLMLVLNAFGVIDLKKYYSSNPDAPTLQEHYFE